MCLVSMMRVLSASPVFSLFLKDVLVSELVNLSHRTGGALHLTDRKKVTTKAILSIITRDRYYLSQIFQPSKIS